MLSFDFNGRNSFEYYGVYISTRPKIPSPKRRVTNVTIPGKSSILRFDEGTYEDITIAVECTVKDNNLIGKIDNIKSWLLGSEESELVFSFQKDRKYFAQVVNSIDFTQTLRCFSKFIIVFNCRPFKYESVNRVITVDKLEEIINPGSIYSEPIIKITGEGDIKLIINEEEISFSDVEGNIQIDTSIQNCYNDKFENLNSKMIGEFPTLKIGNNSIDYVGNISKVEVTPNWRWL